MIVGEGLLARAFESFRSDRNILVFASGVANSRETDPAAFAREASLLETWLGDHPSRFVYFGSCGASNPHEADTPYLRHKREAAQRVLTHPNGMVLMLPQVVAHTSNPNTLTNYLHNKIVRGDPFTVWRDAERNLIDIRHVVDIGSAIVRDAPAGAHAVAIAAARSTPMPELVKMFERVLQRHAHCEYIDQGGPFAVDAHRAVETAHSLGIDLEGDYAERTIWNYYAPH